MMDKPFSQAALNNQGPILSLLKHYLEQGDRVLEIGSGSGQHAVFFAEQIPSIEWQTSDLAHHHAGIRQWIDHSVCDNVLAPIDLDVSQEPTWPLQNYAVVYSANTCHIMSWKEVQAMLRLVAKVLSSKGLFILYGPFNSEGQFTSQSNVNFDAYLKSQQDHMGLRCLDELKAAALLNQLRLTAMHEMPANNKLLVFSKE